MNSAEKIKWLKLSLIVITVYYLLVPFFWVWVVQAPYDHELTPGVAQILYPCAIIAYLFKPYFVYCVWCQVGFNEVSIEHAYREFRNDFSSPGIGFFR
jgi:hypothetical protein